MPSGAQAAPSKASSSSATSSGWRGLNGKQRSRATKRAFDIRQRIRNGQPVTDDERAYVLAYDSDPTRRKIRRSLATPPVAAPAAPVFMQASTAPAAEEAPRSPAPDSAEAPAPAAGDLPPLSVPVDLGTPPPHDEKRAAREALVAKVIAYAKLMNAGAHAAGAVCSLPPDIGNEFLDEVQPVVVSTFTRHGVGFALTPKQEDYVTIGTGLALLVGQVEARERLKKAGAQAPTAASSSPSSSSSGAGPAPSSAAPTPEERPAPRAQASDDEYAGL